MTFHPMIWNLFIKYEKVLLFFILSKTFLSSEKYFKNIKCRPTLLSGLRTTMRSSFKMKKSYVIPNYETLRTFIQFPFFSLFVEHIIDSFMRTTFCHNLWLLYGLIPDWYLHTFFPNSKNVWLSLSFQCKNTFVLRE
jgi:hypothetical protein